MSYSPAKLKTPVLTFYFALGITQTLAQNQILAPETPVLQTSEPQNRPGPPYYINGEGELPQPLGPIFITIR